MAFLKNGFSTTVTFANASGILLKEIEITPPTIDGGDKIDLTTMRNEELKTAAPQALYELQEMQGTFAYDLSVLPTILEQVNVEQLITIHLPPSGAKTEAFWGYMKSFKRSAYKNGERPTAECVFVCTNVNGSGVETGPVYT